MPIIDGINVPGTESEAKEQKWRYLGQARPQAEIEAQPRLGTRRYRADCRKNPPGTLCDAITHADGSVEAYYCDEDHLCTSAYGSP